MQSKKDSEYTTEDFPGLNVTSVSAASGFDCPDDEIPKLRWDYGYNPAFPFMLKNDCDYDDIIIYSSIGTLNQSDDIVVGDVSGDKEVSTSDVLAIFQVVVGKTDFASAKQYIAANVDFDDEPSYFWIPTSKDALKALKIAVGEIEPNRIKPI